MTRLLVLGILNIQPMSGYDIQNILKTNDSERWAGVLLGSIYHALKKMETEKYVEVMGVELTGNRQKTVYKITQSGIEHFKHLISNSLQISSVHYPSTLYSALSFVENIDSTQAINELNKQQKLLENEFIEVQKGMIEKSIALENNISPMTNLIFENMFEIIKLQKEFVNKVSELIQTM